MRSSYSTFEYLYRDAGNYKSWGMVLLSGEVSPDKIKSLRFNLESEEFFIAEQIGLPTLYQSLWNLGGGPNSDDHAYHQFHELRQANDEEISTLNLWGEASVLLEKFREINNRWNCALSLHCWF